MSDGFCPRLSEARNLFPLLRAHLVAAASHHLLPASLSLDLLPIVDEGVYGYEFLPNREAHTYLTMGCNEGGRLVLRKNLYCAEAPSALRLAAVNGRVLSRSELDAWHRIQPRDFFFPDWTSAAQAAWDELADLFPDGPRRPVAIHDAPHQSLDEALAIAHSHLSEWDPLIEFCGVPDEAQYGFALTGAEGQFGHLVLRTPGTWTLRWESAGTALYRQWSAASTENDFAGAWASASMTVDETPIPRTHFVPAISGATSRQR